MRKDTLVIRDGRSAFVFPENGTELILVQLPRFRDCTVHQMLEVANRLPKDFALLLDTKAGCFRILQVADASFLDSLKCGVTKGSSTPNMAHDSSGEIFETQSDQRQLGRTKSETCFVILHCGVGPRKRPEKDFHSILKD
jgi:hypothetical protein